MPRPPSTQPTDGELEILRVLWDAGSLALGALCETLRQQRNVAATTVATMLRLMSDKGLVKRTGSGRAATWSAVVSQEKTERGIVSRMVERVFDGAADRLVAHLVDGGALSDQQLAELRTLLDERAKATSTRRKRGTQR